MSVVASRHSQEVEWVVTTADICIDRADLHRPPTVFCYDRRAGLHTLSRTAVLMQSESVHTSANPLLKDTG